MLNKKELKRERKTVTLKQKDRQEKENRSTVVRQTRKARKTETQTGDTNPHSHTEPVQIKTTKEANSEGKHKQTLLLELADNIENENFNCLF